MKVGKSPLEILVPSGTSSADAKQIKKNISTSSEFMKNIFIDVDMTAQEILNHAFSGGIISAGYDYKSNHFKNNDNVQKFDCVIIDVDDKQGFTYKEFIESGLLEYTYVTYPTLSNTSNMNFRVIIKLEDSVEISDQITNPVLVEFYRELVRLIKNTFKLEYDGVSEKITQLMYGCRMDSQELFPDMCYINEDAVLPLSFLNDVSNILVEKAKEQSEQEEERQKAVIEYNTKPKTDSHFTLEEKLKVKFFQTLVNVHLVRNFNAGKHTSSINFSTFAFQDGFDEYDIWSAINAAIPVNGIHNADYYIREGKKRSSQLGYNTPTLWQLKAIEYSKPKPVHTIADDFINIKIERLGNQKFIKSSDVEEYSKNMKAVINNPANDMKSFIKLNDAAIAWCVGHSIPQEVYSKWFFSISGRWNNKIIIPFYDDCGKMYYFQGVSIIDGKYTNPISVINPIFNLFNIDVSKPVICVDSVIDSLVVDNSISINNTLMNDLSLLPVDSSKLKFILNSDTLGRKTAKTLLEGGFSVFLWKKFIKNTNYFPGVTVNEVLLNNNIKSLTISDIENYFTNNIMLKGLI